MADVPVDFLYTDIGRGHPHYLDGIIACMDPARVGRVCSVFDACRGMGLQGWRLARRLYRSGPSIAVVPALYSRLRRSADFDRPGMLLKSMGRSLREPSLGRDAPLVVAHPMLVGLLRDRPGLFYQHGELAVPPDAVVRGPHHVFVPDAEAADVFVGAGLGAEQVSVTGLCIEPGLADKANAAFAERQSRLAAGQPLTGMFFSSGAEPRSHVSALVAAAVAASREGHTTMLMARRGGRLQKTAERVLRREGAGVVLGTYETRDDLNRQTEARLPSLDFFVAPSHERTPWAMGLGLPMFVVDPPVGTFAPLNRERLLREGVAMALDSAGAGTFGETVTRMCHAGTLQGMAQAGWGRYDINGFRTIAERLTRTL